MALDEDDAIAVITRRLVNEYPLFSGRYLALQDTKPIPPTDTTSFTNIITLYDCLNSFFSGRSKTWEDYDTLDSRYDEVKALWDAMSDNFAPLQLLRDHEYPTLFDITPYRNNNNGGHLLFRPVGVELVVTVIRQLMRAGSGLDEAVRRVAQVPMLLAEYPWVNLLWDPVNHVMVSQSTNQKVASQLLLYMASDGLPHVKVDVEELRISYAGMLHASPETIRLERHVLG